MFKAWTKLSLIAALLGGCGLGSPSLSGNSAGTGPVTASGGGLEHGLGFNPQGARPYDSMGALAFRGTLPGTVDLRSQTSPVGDQGKLGSCTAWAIGNGLREFLEIKQGRGFTVLSPLYLYYKEREADGNLGRDTGSTMTTGMKVLLSIGDAPESDMPYDISRYNDKPSAKAESDAAEFKVGRKLPLNNLNDVKASLAEGYPAVFGFIVYKSFKSIGSDGMMPMPGFMEPTLGGHAVMAVGYDDAKQVVIVRNSWGSKWGDKGHFYMPYKFFGWGRVMDIWSAR